MLSYSTLNLSLRGRPNHDSDLESLDSDDFSINKHNQDRQDHQEKGKEKDTKEKSSFASVSFNIINTAIGGGILGYPYIVRQLGIATGVFFIVLAGLLTVFSTSILQKCKNLSKKKSYIGIAEACFKKKGSSLCSVIIVINTLGGCIIYLTVFATVVRNILEAFVPYCDPNSGSQAFYCKNSVLVPFGGLLMLPFNFMKSIDKLKFVSLLKVAAVFIFTGITVVFSISRMISGQRASDTTLWPNFEEPVSTIACIPSIFFGYNFLYNQFTLYKSLKDPSDEKFAKAIKVSIAFVGFTYLSVGLFGYLLYGSATDNMLINFTKEDLGAVWFTILNIGFLICSLGGIPVTYFPAKNIIYGAVCKQIKKKSKSSGIEYSLNNPSRLHSSMATSGNAHKDKIAYIVVVLVSNAFIILTGIVAPGLNQVLGLLGSIGSASLIFLFPMAFYLKLEGEGKKKKVIPIMLLVFGGIIALAGFATNLLMII